MSLLPEAKPYYSSFIMGFIICKTNYNGHKLLILKRRTKIEIYNYVSKNLYDIIIKDNIVIKNDTDDEYFKEGKIFTDEEISILSTMI